jgi:hypothetical protein
MKSISTYVYVCLSVCVSVCLSVCLSLSLIDSIDTRHTPHILYSEIETVLKT